MQMIGCDISKFKRHPGNINNMVKPPTVLSKQQHYKLVIVQNKETNDVPHKKVIGVTEKQNYTVKICS